MTFGQALSAQSWKVLDRDCTQVISGERARDVLRSVLAASTLVCAVFGVGLFTGLLFALSRYALPLGIAFASCLCLTISLAPVVALRRTRPIILRRTMDHARILEVHQRTRFGFARIEYEVRLPSGACLGRLVHTPLRQTMGPSWRVVPLRGRPIDLTVHSAAAGLVERFRKSSTLWRLTARVLTQARSLLRPRAASSRPWLVATSEGWPEPIVECVADPEAEGWFWLRWRFSPRSAPGVAALVLTAALMSIAD